FPAWANSGQYRATGASRSSRPRSTSMWAQSAVIAFVVEKTLTIVSAVHRRVRPASAQPPQRSTTGSPSTVAANDAPISRPASKLRAKASRTSRKRAAHSPSTSDAAGIADPSMRAAFSQANGQLRSPPTDVMMPPVDRTTARAGIGLGEPPRRRPPRARRWFAAAIAVAALGVGGYLLLPFLRPGPPQQVVAPPPEPVPPTPE